uniref:Plant intracellular Ras-group-related LRR protein 6-like n=1 Tax=Nelumbo nucifera TaxID=4432 RepID=A0A823A1I9_NELNU|nr:TPA_asm: hypothetical protein HUJ06_019106 [Nelumbo nucifera]
MISDCLELLNNLIRSNASNQAYQLKFYIALFHSKHSFSSCDVSLTVDVDLSPPDDINEHRHQIGNMERLTLLNLSRNTLLVEIPSAMNKLSGLEYLDLSENNFKDSDAKEAIKTLLCSLLQHLQSRTPDPQELKQGHSEGSSGGISVSTVGCDVVRQMMQSRRMQW